jgi:hypothetical protein
MTIGVLSRYILFGMAGENILTRYPFSIFITSINGTLYPNNNISLPNYFAFNSYYMNIIVINKCIVYITAFELLLSAKSETLILTQRVTSLTHMIQLTRLIFNY